jgi:hypothetical protein
MAECPVTFNIANDRKNFFEIQELADSNIRGG